LKPRSARNLTTRNLERDAIKQKYVTVYKTAEKKKLQVIKEKLLQHKSAKKSGH